MQRPKKDLPVPTERQREDAEARFKECYLGDFRPLRRYIARFSAQPQEADDLTQEAFVRLWRELERGTPVLSLRAWLYRVATNLVISHFKARSRTTSAQRDREQSVAQFQLAAADDAERVIARRQLVKLALKRLPAPMRQCLLLYHAGLTGREIAEVLGVKPSYVGTLVLRGHARFRREWELLRDCDDLY